MSDTTKREVIKKALAGALETAFIARNVPFEGPYADEAYKDLAEAGLRIIERALSDQEMEL